MNWPLPQDFNEAIQSPANVFSDPELQAGETVTGPMGLPLPHSGNFADVYHVRGADGRDWAVKCFTRPVSGLAQRYAQVAATLDHAKLPFTVDFQFLAQGIRVRGAWRPVIKMEWVEGTLLNLVVQHNADRPSVLSTLSQMWARLCRRLREERIAHADLQHGNIILVPGSRVGAYGLKLIDYDGMYVPTLSHMPSGEAGHPNFQHPTRATTRAYSVDLDRFPLLVVATALKGLEVFGSDLWQRYDTGDNLLFLDRDFRRPEASPLIQDLWESDDSQLQGLVGRLALACERGIAETPWLDDIAPDGEVTPLSVAEEREAGDLLGSRTSVAIPSQPPVEVLYPDSGPDTDPDTGPDTDPNTDPNSNLDTDPYEEEESPTPEPIREPLPDRRSKPKTRTTSIRRRPSRSRRRTPGAILFVPVLLIFIGGSTALIVSLLASRKAPTNPPVRNDLAKASTSPSRPEGQGAANDRGQDEPRPKANIDRPGAAARLERGIASYKEQLKGCYDKIAAWLDEREGKALMAENKYAADQFKAEREMFTTEGQIPPGIPATIREELVAARAVLEAAYTTAIVEYTQLGDDAAVAATEQARASALKEFWPYLDLTRAEVRDGYIKLAPNRGIATRRKHTRDIEIVVVARTEGRDIRLDANRGSGVIWNWEQNLGQLRIRRPDGLDRVESGSLATVQVAPLRPNTWYTLKWRLTQSGMTILVDGSLIFSERKKYDLDSPTAVSVRSMASEIHVNEFTVTPIPAGGSSEISDPVAARRDAALDVFKEEMKTYREKGTAWLEAREATAREAAARAGGDKKALERVKEEQRVFRISSVLPLAAPLSLRQMPRNAMDKLLTAYDAAAREWTTIGNYPSAAQMNATIAKIREWLDPSLSRRVWIHDHGRFSMVGRGQWEEENDTTGGIRLRWTEYDRTEEYVELSISIEGRIHFTRLYEKSDKRRGPLDVDWMPHFGEGKWLE